MTRLAAALALGALALTACGGSTAGAGESAGPQERTLVVLAAASLTESFTTLAEQFEQDNPGVTVTLSFGASSALAQQVLAGAPADLLATASASTMATVTDAMLATGEPVVLATNSLVLVTPPADPGDVDALTDLADAEVSVALCAVSVPCGALAEKVLGTAGVALTPVTLEEDVKAVVSKVSLGEVDAGLVYRTDATAAGDRLRVVDAPALGSAVTSYPAVVLRDAAQAGLAAAFLELVTSPRGVDVLSAQGFRGP